MKKFVKMIRGMDAADRSGIKNILLKPVSMILTLVYTPMLLSYLGDEKYGVWATLLSIITWISYCDIGIGDGLRILLTKELTKEKYEEAKKSVSTAYIILTAIAVVLLIIMIHYIQDLKKQKSLIGCKKMPINMDLFFVIQKIRLKQQE